MFKIFKGVLPVTGRNGAYGLAPAYTGYCYVGWIHAKYERKTVKTNDGRLEQPLLHTSGNNRIMKKHDKEGRLEE
jgi:hypothetical protein